MRIPSAYTILAVLLLVSACQQNGSDDSDTDLPDTTAIPIDDGQTRIDPVNLPDSVKSTFRRHYPGKMPDSAWVAIEDSMLIYEVHYVDDSARYIIMKIEYNGSTVLHSEPVPSDSLSSRAKDSLRASHPDGRIDSVRRIKERVWLPPDGWHEISEYEVWIRLPDGTVRKTRLDKYGRKVSDGLLPPF